MKREVWIYVNLRYHVFITRPLTKLHSTFLRKLIFTDNMTNVHACALKVFLLKTCLIAGTQ